MADTGRVTEHQFTVTYAGPALASGRMPVRALAPALLAFADAVASAATTIYPTTQPPGLALSAAELGSFRVVLHITDPSWLDQVLGVLTAQGVEGTLNGAALMTVVYGAIRGIRALWRRVIRRREDDTPAPGMVRLTLDDDQVLVVRRDELILIQNPTFRHAVHQMIEPLQPGEVESLRIQDVAGSVEITAEEVPAFAVPESADELLIDTEVELALSLVSVAFRDDNKWRFTDGQTTYWASITGAEFNKRVAENKESFSAGDILRVKIQVRQWRTGVGVQMDRTVTRVLSHIRGSQDVPLPFEVLPDETD